MKKVLFTCLMLSAVSFAANAQEAMTAQTSAVVAAQTTDAVQGRGLTPAQVAVAEQKAEKNAKALKTKLGLNEKQYAVVLEAEKAYQKEADKFPAGRIPAGHESNITWERNKQIKAVLTDDQATKYDALQAKTKQ